MATPSDSLQAPRQGDLMPLALHYDIYLNPRDKFSGCNGVTVFRPRTDEQLEMLKAGGVFVFTHAWAGHRARRLLNDSYEHRMQAGLDATFLRTGHAQGPLASFGDWRALLPDETPFFLVPSEETIAQFVRITLSAPPPLVKPTDPVQLMPSQDVRIKVYTA